MDVTFLQPISDINKIHMDVTVRLQFTAFLFQGVNVQSEECSSLLMRRQS